MTIVKAKDTGIQSQEYWLNKTANIYMSRKFKCPNCGFDIQLKMDTGISIKDLQVNLECNNCYCEIKIGDLL